MPKRSTCQGYEETFPDGHQGTKGVMVKCQGNQAENWGGYVKAPPEVERTRQPVIDRASYERSSHRSQRQLAKQKDEHGESTAEAIEAQANLRSARRRRAERTAEELREAVLRDPGRWECMFCQYPDDGTDVYNFADREH